VASTHTEPTKRSWFHLPSALIGFFAGGLIVAIVSCYFLAYAVLGVGMGEGMASPKYVRVLHSAPSTSGEAIAYVIADDCGATCGCATRVDIAFGELYFREAYRSYDHCDLAVSWTSDTVLEVRNPYSEDSLLATIDITLFTDTTDSPTSNATPVVTKAA